MTTLRAVCYHYLSRNDEFKRIWGHSFKLFKKHIEFFLDRFSIINPGDLLAERFEDNKNYLLLTFDDGLAEHKKIADYLSREGIQGVFAVPTCIFRGELLNPQIIHFGTAYYGVRTFYDYCRTIIEQDFREYQPKLISEPAKDSLMTLHKKVKLLFKRELAPIISRRVLLSVLETRLKKDFPDIIQRVHLSKDNIVDMVVQGNYIASHSDSHPVVSEIVDQVDVFNTEVVGSKKILENIIRKPVEIFAYPFGEKADVVPDPSQFVQAGYKQILTTYQASSNFDQLNLGRYCSQSQDDVRDLTEHIWKYNLNTL